MLQKLYEIDKLMRENGIQTDPKTGRKYFTGYSYKHLYDWDQYFESIVQLYLGWDTTYPQHCITIFLDYQNEEGFIPRGVGISNGVKEQESEPVKPFLAQIALLIYNRDGNIDFLSDVYYEKMKKYLMYWIRRADENGHLAYWNSAVHTGMDNQHERAGYWMDCYCCGVDLNCYLLRECRAFSIIAKLKGYAEDEAFFEQYASYIHNAVQTRMWDEEDGLFYDINRHTGEKIKVKHIGIFAVMWADIANQSQVDIMLERHLFNEAEFQREFPYPALAATEPGYSEELLPTDISYVCNWRANTWIPSNYFIFQGLRKYGYADKASELAQITCQMVDKIGLYEYYKTESKQGTGLHPFWGWTLLAYFMPFEALLGYDPTEVKVHSNQIHLI